MLSYRNMRPTVPLAAEVSDELDIEPVSQTIALEPDVSAWLATESRRLRTPPSVIISTLLEWARDEDILEGDSAFFPSLKTRRTRRGRTGQ
jgi:hypothetical protein